MTHGLKSLAQELPQYGRYGDDMVAHISSDEARLLKSLGGSGTINPTTGLPEFGLFGIGGGGGFLGTGINKNASDPVSNALSNNPVSKGVSNLVQSGAGAIDQGLVSLDKTVGKAIPGGWGTVGMAAGSMMGLPTWAMTGLGALNGSGVLRKGGKFNLQGAMMGGAMAYGMSELGEYARGAADGVEGGTKLLPESSTNIKPPIDVDPNIANASGSGVPNVQSVPQPSPYGSLNSPTLNQPIGAPSVNPTLSANGLSPYAGNVTPVGMGGVPQPGPGILDRIGTAITNAPANAAEYISNIPGRIAESASSAYDTVTNPQTYSDLGTKASNYADARLADVGKTTTGIQNLVGLGEGTAKQAAAMAAKTGVNPMLATASTIYAGTGLAALEEQKKYLEESKKSNAISQAEYDQAMAEINRSTENARTAVRENPFSINPNRDVSMDPTYYSRNRESDNLYDRLTGGNRLYADGGFVGPEIGAAGLSVQLQGGPVMRAEDIPAYLNRSGPVIGDKAQMEKDAAAREFVANNPININVDTSAPIGASLYSQPEYNAALYEKNPELYTLYDRFKRRQYADGGVVNPPDDQTGMPNVSPIKNFQGGMLNTGGIMGYAVGGQINMGGGYDPFANLPNLAGPIGGRSPDDGPSSSFAESHSMNPPSNSGFNMNHIAGMATGGMPPRFLSGGGDGMSDSIPANISGKQEARLADGEFVIPADVVSHLGNGSSKAGAKQLYSMMDKVRTARTGRKSQGKQINPRKYLPA